MKTINPGLTADHLKAYQSGFNALRYTQTEEKPDETPDAKDIFVGLVKHLYLRNNGEKNTLHIVAEWIVRIRNIGLPHESINWQIIPGSFKRIYLLEFESPELVKERSPLTIRSDGALIEITHVTDLARIVQMIEMELIQEGQLPR